MKLVLELLPSILAFGAGAILFRKLNFFFKLIFFQSAIYLTGEYVAIWLIHEYRNNNWLYNLTMPVETALLCFAAYCFLKKKLRMRTVIGLYLGFVVVYLLDIVLYTGFRNFAYHAAIAEGLLMSGLFIFMLYQVLMNRQKKGIDGPVAIASFGMLVYFACSIPYLCLIFYFQEKDSEQNDVIFQYVITTLSSLRYLLIAIAFYLEAYKKPDVLSREKAVS